jgi:hypothetical protein
MIWTKAAWRFASDVFGSFTLIALFVWALVDRRVHPAAKYLLVGGFLTTLVFSHLVLHHHHYYLMFTPAVAILVAVAIARAEKFFIGHNFKPLLVSGVAGVILLAGLFQGLMAFKAFTTDPFPKNITAIIRSQTVPQEKLVVINGGWGGDALISANRQGLSMWNTRSLENPKHIVRLKQLGFTKLVIISESPFQNAIQVINPGQAGIARVMAKSYLTPLVENWPTIYTSDDIIIKGIP